MRWKLRDLCCFDFRRTLTPLLYSFLLVLAVLHPAWSKWPRTSCLADNVEQDGDVLWLHLLFNSTNGDSWNRNCSMNLTHPCDSPGVFCSRHSPSRVIGLRLKDCNLTGTLPEIPLARHGAMSHLTLLHLDTNHIFSTLPESFGNLSNLTVLILSNNEISGSIPESYRRLSNLTNLTLHANNLSGTVPSFIGTFSNLTMLTLSSNNFSGTIPWGESHVDTGGLCALSALRILLLFRNSLRGTLSECIGSSLSELIVLMTDVNQLNGTIPHTIGSLTKLQCLSLSDNRFTGALPSSIANLKSLSVLNVSSNVLSGPIPSTVGFMQRMVIINLSHNTFNETLPAAVGWLLLVAVDMSHNQLLGTIPSTWILPPRMFVCRDYENCETPILSMASDLVAVASFISVENLVGVALEDNCMTIDLRLLPQNSSDWLRMRSRNGSHLTPQREQQSCSPVSLQRAEGPAAGYSISVLGGVVTATAFFGLAAAHGGGGADALVAMDVVSLAALQSVPCSEYLLLRRSANSDASPLRYVLSPFSDFGPAVASLGNVGIVVAITVAHGAVVAVLCCIRGRGRGPRPSATCLKQCVACFLNQHGSTVCSLFPAVPLTVFSLLVAGSVRGALLSLFADPQRDITSLIIGAAAVSAAVLMVAAAVWISAVRWVGFGHARYRAKPQPWVEALLQRVAASSVPGSYWRRDTLRWTVPRGWWSPRVAQRRLGIVFASVTGTSQRWVPGVILLHTIVFVGTTAAPVGLRDVTGCTALHGVLSVVALLPVVVLVARRLPYRIVCVNVLNIVIACLMSATAAITSAALHDDGWRDTALVWISALAAVQYVVSTLRGLLMMLVRVLETIFTPPAASDEGNVSNPTEPSERLSSPPLRTSSASRPANRDDSFLKHLCLNSLTNFAAVVTHHDAFQVADLPTDSILLESLVLLACQSRHGD